MIQANTGIVNAGNEYAGIQSVSNKNLHVSLKTIYFTLGKYQCFIYMHSSSSNEECFECEMAI